jgi:regulator of sigma E protease
MTLLDGQEVTVVVERGPEGAKKRVNVKVPPQYHRTFGVRMKMGQISAVRLRSPAAAGKLQEGDVIEKVEVSEPDGKGGSKVTAFEKGVNLDPVRLPDQLKQWASRAQKTADKAKPKVKLTVKRQSTQNGGPVFEPNPVTIELEWDDSWRFDRVMPMGPTSPQAIPELGLAYLVKNEVDGVEPGVTSAQLQKDDEITDVNFVGVKPDDTTIEGGWQSKPLKGTEWANIFARMQAPELVGVKVKVKRAGKEIELDLKPIDDSSWPMDERGLAFANDSRIEKADNVFEAIGMGFRDTHRSIMQVYLVLRGLLTGKVAVENLGGPVTIATVAYKFAQFDFWEYLFFLGLISINLAVLNFLPVPVLDGGHMVFLLYEKLRGKPASEGIRAGATYAGLAILGCLMLFVLFLDIRRLVSG